MGSLWPSEGPDAVHPGDPYVQPFAHWRSTSMRGAWVNLTSDPIAMEGSCTAAIFGELKDIAPLPAPFHGTLSLCGWIGGWVALFPQLS